MTDRKPAYLAAAYMPMDALTSEIADLLQKRCGEQVHGMLSVDSDKALLAMIPLVVQLLAPRKDHAELIALIRDGVAEMQGKIARAANAPKQ